MKLLIWIAFNIAFNIVFYCVKHSGKKNLDSFVKLRTCLTNFTLLDKCAIMCKISDFRVRRLKKKC